MATKAPEHLLLPPNGTKMPIVGLGTWQVSITTLIIDLGLWIFITGARDILLT